MLSANYGNVVPAAIVVAVIYIIINSLLTLFAGWLERRTRRSGHPRSARPGARGDPAAAIGPTARQPAATGGLSPARPIGAG